MTTKAELKEWILEALDELGGSAGIVDVARVVWQRHEAHLRESDSLFFTWQYDMRWCAFELREAGTLKAAKDSPSGTWELA